MKKISILLIFVIGLLSSSYIGSETYSNTQTVELGCTYSQCQATAKSTGNRCKHCVSNAGDYYCWQHK